MMLEKGLVLRRQIGADKERRIIAVLELHAPFAGIAVDRLAVGVAHYGRQGRLIFQQRRRIGQAAREDEPEQRISEQETAKADRDPAEPAPVPMGLEALPKTAQATTQALSKG